MTLLLLLAACTTKPDPVIDPADDSATVPTDSVGDTTESAPPPDADGDGSPDTEDCDDADAAVYPGAIEVCNGADDDCDSAVDEDLPTSTWYRDDDGDGYGSPVEPVELCALPAGYAPVAGDCDDTDGATFPGAEDPGHDGIDQDCDGVNLCDPATLTEYPGNISFVGPTAEAEMTAFCAMYDAVAGYVHLRDVETTDLTALSCLRCANWLYIESDATLTSLDGLDQLEWLGDALSIWETPNLMDISGLSGLREINGSLLFVYAPLVVDWTPLAGLDRWPPVVTFESTGLTDLEWLDAGPSLEYLSVFENVGLTDLRGLGGLEEVVGGSDSMLWISQNDAMTSMDGLDALTAADKLVVESNDALTDLTALYGLRSVGDLMVRHNRALPQAEIDAFLAAVGKENIHGNIYIEDNGP